MLWWSCIAVLWTVAAGVVLDPSLYLSPGPPLLPSGEDMSPEERWDQKLEPRVERDAELLVVPLDDSTDSPRTTESAEPMEKSETFWLGYRAGNTGLYGVPLSFGVSGTYGRYAAGANPGMLANNYAFMGTNTRGVNSGYGSGSLAGSGYGSYGLGGFGTRVYGGNTGATWSGWGNGKWGHYGKG